MAWPNFETDIEASEAETKSIAFAPKITKTPQTVIENMETETVTANAEEQTEIDSATEATKETETIATQTNIELRARRSFAPEEAEHHSSCVAVDVENTIHIGPTFPIGAVFQGIPLDIPSVVKQNKKNTCRRRRPTSKIFSSTTKLTAKKHVQNTIPHQCVDR